MTPEILADLHASCFPERPWSREEFEQLVAQQTTLLIKDADGRGFLVAQVIPPEAEILTVAVSRAHRRQGIARGLLDQLNCALEQQGTDRVYLEVAADNPAAIALYEASGFALTGRRPSYYRRPGGNFVDGLSMQRALG